MSWIFEPKVGQVLLEDIVVKQKGPVSFMEKKYDQPVLAKIIGFKRPEDPILEWDERIEVGAVVLKPVTAKQEFDDGKGGKLAICHHSDIRVFCKWVD
jgi:hypothetical protein